MTNTNRHPCPALYLKTWKWTTNPNTAPETPELLEGNMAFVISVRPTFHSSSTIIHEQCDKLNYNKINICSSKDTDNKMKRRATHTPLQTLAKQGSD
jgi:hypothetical protein